MISIGQMRLRGLPQATQPAGGRAGVSDLDGLASRPAHKLHRVLDGTRVPGPVWWLQRSNQSPATVLGF